MRKTETDRNLTQRVGGRAGTAVPKGAVCELPNPVKFLPSPPLQPRSVPRFPGCAELRMHPTKVRFWPSSFRSSNLNELRSEAAHNVVLECRANATVEALFRQDGIASLTWIRGFLWILGLLLEHHRKQCCSCFPKTEDGNGSCF